MNTYRLSDQKALDELLARTHVRVAKGRAVIESSPKPPAPKRPKAPRLPKPPSSIEQEMWLQIKASGLPEPMRQLRYLESRKFNADFAWPRTMNGKSRRVALEVDGGAHKTEERFSASFERAYLLMMAGWRVLHVGKREVRNGKALEWITKLLEQTQGGT